MDDVISWRHNINLNDQILFIPKTYELNCQLSFTIKVKRYNSVIFYLLEIAGKTLKYQNSLNALKKECVYTRPSRVIWDKTWISHHYWQPIDTGQKYSSTLAFQYNPIVWGVDHMEFRPKRFAKENQHILRGLTSNRGTPKVTEGLRLFGTIQTTVLFSHPLRIHIIFTIKSNYSDILPLHKTCSIS